MVAGLTTKSIGVEGDTALTAYVQGVAKLVDEYDKAIAKGGDVTKATADYDQGVKALTASLEKAKTAQESAIKAYNDSVDAEIAARQQQIDLQVASVGLSQREIQQLQAKAQIQEEVARKIEQLNRQRSQPGANVGFIDAEIAKQQSSLPILLRQQDDLYSKMNALRGDWMTGVETIWNEYIDQGRDVAGMTAQTFNDAFSGMENAMVNFV
jgi:lambda family phage tail tape measure protein